VNQLEANGIRIPTSRMTRGHDKDGAVYKDVDKVVNQMTLRQKTELFPEVWDEKFAQFVAAVDEANRVYGGGGEGGGEAQPSSPSAFGPIATPGQARPQGQIQTTPTRPVGFDEDPNNPGHFIRR